MIDYEIETDSPDNDMWVVCLHTVYRDGYIYCTCSVCLSVHLSVSPLCKVFAGDVFKMQFSSEKST